MKRRTFIVAASSTALLAPLARRARAAGGSLPAPGGVGRVGRGDDDPLLAPWTGAFGGVPPFQKVKVAAFKGSMLKAMELLRAELAAITAATTPPTFDDTMGAFEGSGRPYGRVSTIFDVYTSTMNDKAMQALDLELSPVRAAFGDEITQNAALFVRLKALYDGRAALELAPEQLRLLERTYKRFERRGAALDATKKKRLAAINQELAKLYTTFSQNQLHDEEEQALILDAEADLAGLPDGMREAMKADATRKGLAGKWRVANTRSAMEPFLTLSTRRDLREKAFKIWMGRGETAGAHDNRPVITRMLALRGERARLLGYKTHAHWIIDDGMARTPDAARALLMKVWTAAVARAKEEVADMQAIADAEKAGIKIEAWDYRFYAEKVRKAKFDLDEDEVKPYLQLDKLREALFWSSGQLYGLKFKKLAGIPVYHPDVTVYEVTRGKARVGLWYFDPYAREGKSSGAWMNEYRTQERLEPTTPIVSNNANFVHGAKGKPVLISWDDARTLFHEFGHALHGLLSNVTYAALAGTNTKRDFVEFPSQLNEHWLSTPEVLSRFARHHQTGKVIPKALLDKIERARNFNQGFKTVEALSAAIYDLEIHSLTADTKIDPIKFEAETMKRLGCPKEIVMRHRPPAFGHIFSGDGYSAGYYSYLWADTLTADAAEAFVEAGSFYDKATAKRLHDDIMSVGDSIPPEEAFRRFRGRDVDPDALLRDRGFAPAKAKKA